MLHHRQQFQMGVPHFYDIGYQLLRQFVIVEGLAVGIVPQVLINDGRVLDGGLAYRGLTRGWLTRELSSRGYRSPSEVLLLTIDDAGKILCIGKEWAK